METETSKILTEMFIDNFNLDEAKEDIHFLELGAKSIDVMKLQIAIKKKFGVKIDFKTLYGLGTINAIAEYVNKSVA
ncbi:acyl carrier protein [Lachnospira pectinoschiza]|uniref:Acyl carrier protein n=1 Tax=Lachnospira pectinoschiza TaxID=28052 RepID=A0A1G9TAN4_9FIRM|nr:acyl carrier protein [Lachnospira pectinoschiza]SDM44704.1 Acyl carrier protein [Lachnospira pectinoschiza]